MSAAVPVSPSQTSSAAAEVATAVSAPVHSACPFVQSMAGMVVSTTVATATHAFAFPLESAVV